MAGQVIAFAVPPHYYDIRAFEQTGRVYERLGIRRFKRLVRRGILRLNPPLHLSQDRTDSTLDHLEREMRKAETSHLYIFLLMVIFISWVAFAILGVSPQVMV